MLFCMYVHILNNLILLSNFGSLLYVSRKQLAEVHAFFFQVNQNY